MKKAITFCTILVLLCGFAAQAQVIKPSPEQQAKKLTKQMSKSLKLSDSQKKKVADINLQFTRKQEELKLQAENEEIDQVQLRKETLYSIAERNNQLKAVLSMTQYNNYMGYDAATKKVMTQERLRQQKEEKEKKLQQQQQGKK